MRAARHVRNTCLTSFQKVPELAFTGVLHRRPVFCFTQELGDWNKVGPSKWQRWDPNQCLLTPNCSSNAAGSSAPHHEQTTRGHVLCTLKPPSVFPSESKNALCLKNKKCWWYSVRTEKQNTGLCVEYDLDYVEKCDQAFFLKKFTQTHKISSSISQRIHLPNI